MSSQSTLSLLFRLSPACACLWALPANAQSLITNGTFDEVQDPWWPYAAEPALQTVEVTEGRLCSTITEGGENTWDVILGLSDLALLPNQYYHISFSASADVNREIRFKTGLGEAPYTDYFIKTVLLTPTPATFDFTYLNLRDDPATQFQFHIGGSAGVVCVDDVVLEPVAAPTLPAYTTPAFNGRPLKELAALVKMGVAVDTPTFLSRPDHNAIVAGEFSMITPANSMKMNIIQGTQGVWDYTETDALYDFATQNGIEFHGHPLVWHTQTPTWLTDEANTTLATREGMIQAMYDHIDALVTHYTGKFPYWDVVNEAIDQVDGAWTFRPTVWHDRIGDDFIDLAFQRAREKDPTTKLLYNDYNIEQMGNAKADRVFQLISDMKTRGIPIDGVGFQSHYYVTADGGTTGVPDMAKIRANMDRYAEIGVDVHITECDFRVGKPLDPTKEAMQSKFYADLLQTCIDAPNCSHYTLWGLSDYDSWVPSTFPEYDFAHIFDANFTAKPAYQALVNVFAAYNPDGTPIGGGGGATGAGGTGNPGEVGGGTATTGGDAGTAAGGAGTGNPGGGSKSGCSVTAPSTRGTAPWLVALGGLLGLATWSRRSRRSRAEG